MGHVRGEPREQSALFPVSLDELIPADHLCRVIDAFVARLDLRQLGFAKASPAATVAARPPAETSTMQASRSGPAPRKRARSMIGVRSSTLGL